MCRNVFIYFDRAEQSQVLDEFWGAISEGGYLVLGRTEKLAGGGEARFETVNARERIFRKPMRS
jgi:chemotaxis protein methyltransferase CheR